MNEIQEHLEEEKAKLEVLRVNSRHAEQWKQTQLSISIAIQQGIIDSLERLIEKLK